VPVLRNIGCLATCSNPDGQGDIGPIPDAALAWRDGTISWVGPASELPTEHSAEPVLDAGGRLVVPGLVDCHTHLGFGGWRADEFAARIRGAGYLEIARAGGGILSTVRATRELVASNPDGLLRHCRDFATRMLELGVTTIECKSGYGLDRDTELALLRAYRSLHEAGPSRVVSTFLGAHVVPPEYRSARADYIALLVEDLIPSVAEQGLASFCDVFVEDTAFSPAEGRTILAAALSRGLRPKLHVDQLTDGGGAALSAEVGAVSADHLEFASQDGLSAMASAGVVGVTLPIAALYLDQPPAPARAMIEAGVAVAVATDFNPGTAPSYHLPFALTLACTRQRMTPAEALKGATRFAARALCLEGDIGSLEPGKAADFALVDAPDVDHWLYQLGPNACVGTWIAGAQRWGLGSAAPLSSLLG
jgi:imidazolonepropionase